MDKLCEDCPELGPPAPSVASRGALMPVPNLGRAECANEFCYRKRARCVFTRDNLRFLVNWRQVGADELGSIREPAGLHPRLNQEAANFELISPPVTSKDHGQLLPRRPPGRSFCSILRRPGGRCRRRQEESGRPWALLNPKVRDPAWWFRALLEARSPPHCQRDGWPRVETMSQAHRSAARCAMSSVTASSASIEPLMAVELCSGVVDGGH